MMSLIEESFCTGGGTHQLQEAPTNDVISRHHMRGPLGSVVENDDILGEASRLSGVIEK